MKKRWPQRSSHIFSGPEVSPFSTSSPPQCLLRQSGPSHQRFPCRCLVGSLSCLPQANQRLWPRADTLFQSALQQSQARTWGQKGQAGQQLVDEWEGKKGFFLSIGRGGASHFQNVVFIPRPSSAGECGDGREAGAAAAAWPDSSWN